MAHFLGRLAGAAAQHWKRSLALVVVVLVGIGGLAAAGDSFYDDFSTPGTESQQAQDLLEERFPTAAGDTATIVFSGDVRAADAAIERVRTEVAEQPRVTGVSEPVVSRDGRVAYTMVQYDAPAPELGRKPGERLAELSAPGLEMDRNGPVVDQAEQAAAPIGELIGIAVAVLVLTLVFRSWAAMAITLISA